MFSLLWGISPVMKRNPLDWQIIDWKSLKPNKKILTLPFFGERKGHCELWGYSTGVCCVISPIIHFDREYFYWNFRIVSTLRPSGFIAKDSQTHMPVSIFLRILEVWFLCLSLTVLDRRCPYVHWESLMKWNTVTLGAFRFASYLSCNLCL